MEVKLLNYTSDCQGLVAKAAKLCYSSSSIDDLIDKVDNTDVNHFIKKLIKSGHHSVFEHVNFTFGIEGVSRVLSHQLVRHRIASFSQQSQRYVKLDKTFGFIIPESVEGNRPAYEEFCNLVALTHKIYRALLDCGIPAEDARYVLPNATETKIVVSMNARSLFNFFKVRCCNRAQWEIRELATRMLITVKAVAPIIFKDSGPGCLLDRCQEGDFSCGKLEEVREKFEAF
jgi:thymidylate synthase (FAD)